MIDAKQIGVGEPEFLVICSWGPPDQTSRYLEAGVQSRALWYERSKTTVYTDGDRVVRIER
jgi:hypothetical protein